MITSMLCEKPEGRPEASELKAELENWVRTCREQQNMRQQNVTVWVSQEFVISHMRLWKRVYSDEMTWCIIMLSDLVGNG